MPPQIRENYCKIHKLESGKFDSSQGIVREFCSTDIVDTMLSFGQVHFHFKVNKE